MNSFFFAAASACWLGILTSISPCPLASNIAAISFIGNRFEKPRLVLLTGLLYTLGRTLTYVVLGMLLVASVLSIPKLAMFLQQYMNKFLGPILIVAGLFLLEVWRPTFSGGGLGARMQGRVEKYGIWGAAVLGLVFALSFCPISAALFFGSLIPIAIEHESGILMPTLYGIGTALPVVVVAVFLAVGTRFVGTIFNKLTVFERWARRVTGVIFLLVGVYYTLIYLFNVPLL